MIDTFAGRTTEQMAIFPTRAAPLPDGGSFAASAAALDEGAQAGREPVGFGEVDEVPAVWPLFDLQPGDEFLKVTALAGAQVVSEHAEARRVDAGHGRLDLLLQLTRVLAKQLFPVAEDYLPADVLALELPHASSATPGGSHGPSAVRRRQPR